MLEGQIDLNNFRTSFVSLRVSITKVNFIQNLKCNKACHIVIDNPKKGSTCKKLKMLLLILKIYLLPKIPVFRSCLRTKSGPRWMLKVKSQLNLI